MVRGGSGLRREQRFQIRACQLLCCTVLLIIASIWMMMTIYRSTKVVSTINKPNSILSLAPSEPEEQYQMVHTQTPLPPSEAKVLENSTPDSTTVDASTIKNANEYESYLLNSVQEILRSHAFQKLIPKQKEEFSMADYFAYLAEQPECVNLPIFTSMANVFSELYWQLIENFIYTMVKFNLVQCSVMVCVSDVQCVQRCAQSSFPCIDFQYQKFHQVDVLPSALEQIGVLKLFHLPQALKRKVDIMMLDLDVGFLQSPLLLLQQMDPKVDVYLQKDIAYVMNRSREGWRTWYTTPLPNIGIFFVRGNLKTVEMFNIAWREYQAITKQEIKKNPGKDQNKVALALQVTSARGLKWRYFPPGATVLLDMLYKFYSPLYELGGRAAQSLLVEDALSNSYRREEGGKMGKLSERTKDVGEVRAGGVVAVHTTCYEQKVKVMGLKAVNAFWNPFYYSPSRRTLSKPLVYFNDQQLLGEIRTLFYLAIVTKRALLLPNVLGESDGQGGSGGRYEGRELWPGFRLPFFIPPRKTQKCPPWPEILEGGYYYRIERDYSPPNHTLPLTSPTPLVLEATPSLTVQEVETALRALDTSPRVVLSFLPPIPVGLEIEEELEKERERVVRWAGDSVGGYDEYHRESVRYGIAPKLAHRGEQGELARQVVQCSRLCKDLFQFERGNRSCFNKCD